MFDGIRDSAWLNNDSGGIVKFRDSAETFSFIANTNYLIL